MNIDATTDKSGRASRSSGYKSTGSSFCEDLPHQVTAPEARRTASGLQEIRAGFTDTNRNLAIKVTQAMSDTDTDHDTIRNHRTTTTGSRAPSEAEHSDTNISTSQLDSELDVEKVDEDDSSSVGAQIARQFRRVPFPVWVALAIILPTAFFVGMSISKYVAVQATSDYITAHTPLIEAAGACQESLMAERGITTQVLSRNNTQWWTRMRNAWVNTDNACGRLLDLSNDSKDSSFHVQFSFWMVEKLRDLSTVRFQVSSMYPQMDSSKARAFYRSFIRMTDGARSIVASAKEMASAAGIVFEIKLVQQVVNELGSCRAVGAEVITYGVQAANAAPNGSNGNATTNVSITNASIPATVATPSRPQVIPTRIITDFTMCKLNFESLNEQLRYFIKRPTSFDTQPANLQLQRMMNALFDNMEGPYAWTADEWFFTFSGAIQDTALLSGYDQTIRDNMKKELSLLLVALMLSALSACFIMWLQFTAVNTIRKTVQKVNRLHRSVSKFVPRAFLKLTGCTSILHVMQGEQTPVAVTMLFSDIRNFTEVSGGMTSEELFTWLEAYMGKMTTIVEKNGGFVDKFIGDAVFAIFSSPSDAARAAIDMQKESESLNMAMTCRGANEGSMVRIGIGIHHGVASAGFMGDRHRLNAMLVSCEVNLASRLEGLTKYYGSRILISESAASQMDESKFAFRKVGPVKVKGGTKSLVVYELFQTDAPRLQHFKADNKATFEMAVGKRADGDVEGGTALLLALKAQADALDIRDTVIEWKLAHILDVDCFGEK